jgi:hypothetical protein
MINLKKILTFGLNRVEGKGRSSLNHSTAKQNKNKKQEVIRARKIFK